MRALILGEETNRRVQTLREYAEKPENYHLIGPGGTQASVPGDNPNFVTHLAEGFRVVYTITKADGKLWRHISISVANTTKFPNPFAAYTIAQMFGFTGWDNHTLYIPQDWLAKRDGPAIMLAQEYKPS